MDKAGENGQVSKWPIIYSPVYNVSFCKLEKLHLFDAHKWGNIFEDLKMFLVITKEDIIEPEEATEEELLVVHTEKYLKSLKKSWKVALIAEMAILAVIPNRILQRNYLRPMRFQVKGTLVAGEVALRRGWAINLGGGFHHASAESGSGFCPYADISLLVTRLLQAGLVSSVMIVDLDAHQGNGYETDLVGDRRVFIMDVYNREVFPGDAAAKRAIRCRVELDSYIKDDDYLFLVKANLDRSLDAFRPDLIIYNAGTDILSGDPLGHLSVSADGIVQRDEIVFSTAIKNNIPIVMLTSGGYLKETAHIISKSIANLHQLGLIKN